MKNKTDSSRTLYSYKNYMSRNREVSQSAKYLPGNQEELSSDHPCESQV